MFLYYANEGSDDVINHSTKTVQHSIGLITVFNTILTGRQSGPRLQCLYGNPIANNFFQN